jgi:hypothetical protein
MWMLLGPVIVKMTNEQSQYVIKPCPNGLETRYERISTGSFITLVDDSFLPQTQLPYIRLSDFRQGLKLRPRGQWYDRENQTFASFENSTTISHLKYNSHEWLIINNSLIPEKLGTVQICGKKRGSFFYAESIEKVDF